MFVLIPYGDNSMQRHQTAAEEIVEIHVVFLAATVLICSHTLPF